MIDVLTNILKNDRLNEYPLFKKFCSLKEKGLRKESFKALSSFIDEAKTLNVLWYSFHHISKDLYLGDIKEDQALLIKSRQLNNKIECQQTRKSNNKQLNYYQDLLNDRLLFKEEQSKGFVEWCENKGRSYPWVKSYYYEK
ncbi:hypothetical protein NNG64_11365 [Bacillus siamensis]|uniref:Uncharacterized protein n=1 Tax=Bacillus siamensis TaxID=659243 RepID=A0AAI8HQ58_9BACI|nr:MULTISPECIES: hypothetical protein [Bacillus]AME05687.1 hypothetical protein AUL54_04620 [Bacillus sp. SDLI1]AUJ78114.1 hypothetical protein CWD84_15395 [Bacillus siamensis]UUA82742.1 hypothetical protein NNG64_11365 [Bacillus siamensis]